LRGRELPCHVLLCRESVNRVKPDPEHLLRALSRLRRKSHEAIMVGDHPTDMQAGRAVSMRTVGVLSGAGNRDSLLAAGADEVVSDVTALASELLRAKGRPRTLKRRGASGAKAAGLPLSRSRSR
jgi:phosphoglycolate phosphatase